MKKILAVGAVLLACSAWFGALYFAAWTTCTPDCHGANDSRYEGR